MRIHLIAVGERLPRWAAEALAEYRRRLPRELTLVEQTVAGGAGATAPAERRRAEEGRRLRGAIPPWAWRVALDPRGEAWSSEALARRLERWRMEGRPVAMLIGGAEGLIRPFAPSRRRSGAWGRSPLPHALVRVIVVEQLYRAATMLSGHPYHRG